MQPEKMALVSADASSEELILRNFAATIGRKRYEHWFQQKTQVRIEGDEFIVAIANPFLVHWISQKFRAGILAAARPVMGDAVNVRFEVQTVPSMVPSTESPTGPQSENLGDMVPPPSGLPLVESHSACVYTKSDACVSSSLHSTVVPRNTDTSTQTVSADRVQADYALALSVETASGAAASGETLRLMCRDTHATSSVPQPMSLKFAVAAATVAAQAKTVTDSVSAKPHADMIGPTGHSTSRQSVSRQPADKPLTDKPLPSVSRITKESQLTLAKVKAVDEPPRSARRYADLMDLVEGPCNEFALSAARQVCQAPGAQFTALFVHGPVGVGKTHVLEGIHRDLKQRFPSRQVVYLTAEAFANFFTQALRDHKLPSFRQKFRSIDVLIVDDIDFLDGKRGIQEEFLFTVQQLESHGRMVVVAAHGHPRLLTKMSDELRTRFLAGMVCRIDAPDVVTRRRIIENKALRAGADFAPDVFQFVADRFKSNVRELEGAFNTLLAYQRMQGRRLSLTAARNALADLERDCIRVVRMADIEQAVCSLFGVTLDDLKSAKRQKSLSQPRMLAMYLARKHTRAAYTEIGQHFGGRNHSTVMAAEKKIQASMTEQEPIIIRTQSWRMTDLIETLEQQLQAG